MQKRVSLLLGVYGVILTRGEDNLFYEGYRLNTFVVYKFAVEKDENYN